MNRDEAKFILRAYRPGGRDADDPQFREALDMLKRDPVLADWFAQEQALDSRLSEKLRAFPVPPDLKGQLLAARKVMSLRVWWRRPVWMAAAACVVFAVALASILSRSPGTLRFAEFRSYVVDTTTKLDHLDVRSRDLAELRQWLQNRGAPGEFTIPAGLTGQPSIGCRIFEWRGRTVSLVCFNLQNGHDAHLFVIDRAALRSVPLAIDPQFAASSGGISTAAWSTGPWVYVLASDLEEPELRRLL